MRRRRRRRGISPKDKGLNFLNAKRSIDRSGCTENEFVATGLNDEPTVFVFFGWATFSWSNSCGGFECKESYWRKRGIVKNGRIFVVK